MTAAPAAGGSGAAGSRLPLEHFGEQLRVVPGAPVHRADDLPLGA